MCHDGCGDTWELVKNHLACASCPEARAALAALQLPSNDEGQSAVHVVAVSPERSSTDPDAAPPPTAPLPPPPMALTELRYFGRVFKWLIAGINDKLSAGGSSKKGAFFGLTALLAQ